MWGIRTVQKHKLAIAGLVCLTGVAFAPLAVTSFGGGSDLSLPGVQTAERLMAMLDARSPGEREAGALTQSKRRLASAPRVGTPGKPSTPPLEQLAQVIVPPPPASPVEVVPPILPPPASGIVEPPAVLAGAPGGFGSGGFGPGIVVGGVGAPPAGGGSPPGGGTPPTTEVPPVTSAVPEPGTWAMMLLGFAMIGSAMPRPRRRALFSAQA